MLSKSLAKLLVMGQHLSVNHSLMLQIDGSKYRVMHQSFVTTAPPPTGKGRDYDFSAFSALL